VGLGSSSDLSTPALVLKTAADEDTGVNIPASAFPLVLTSTGDYTCGDTIILNLVDDNSSGYGINVLAGKVLAETGTGSFTGPDTYTILDALLTANTGAVVVD
jgi:hypothetical protein